MKPFVGDRILNKIWEKKTVVFNKEIPSLQLDPILGPSMSDPILDWKSFPARTSRWKKYAKKEKGNETIIKFPQ